MDPGRFRGANRARWAIALSLLPALAGCALSHSRAVWIAPVPPPPVRDATGSVAAAEANLSAGRAADRAGNPVAIDYYYAAAVDSWPLHVAGAADPADDGSQLYRAAVRKLLDAAAH